MDLLFALWLPILLSGVAVFFLSFVMWMVMPHHKSDWAAIPDEDKLMEAIGDAPRGMYMFPFCDDPEQFKAGSEWTKKRDAGPSGTVIVRPRGPWSMGKSLAQSFVFNLVVSFCTAYVATIGLVEGAPEMDVFRLTATVSFLAYSGALIWDLIWWQKPLVAVGKNLVDGLLYGIATGALFMVFWPGA